MKVDKQIEYWLNGAREDIETAEILISKGKILHGLFFCHLTVEKTLKAIYVKNLKEVPPKTHNLIFLIDKLSLEVIDSYIEFLGILMKYQLEGRYPDYNPTIPSEEKANEYLNKTKEIKKWIEQQL